MHQKQPQTREQFRVGDPVDPQNLNCRITCAHSYECDPSGSHWGEVVSRLARPSSTQSVLSSDVVDTNEGHRISHALHDHALVLQQQTYLPDRTFISECRHSLMSVSSSYIDLACTPSCHLSSKSTELFTHTFVENPNYRDKKLSASYRTIGYHLMMKTL